MRWLVVLLMAAACSFDPSGVASMPGIVVDSGTTIDGESTIDADPADAGPPDAGPPDANSDDLCTTKYGAAMSFSLCSSTAVSCSFYVVTAEDTCNNLCGAFGGTCQESWDGTCSALSGPQACTPVHFDQVCQCSLP